MSAPIKPHAVHPSGGQIIAYDDLGLASIVVGPTVPTAAGYGVGCIFIHSDGGAGTALYVNEGTSSSTSFQALATAGGAADVSLDDDVDLALGTGIDALLRWSTGDASDHGVVLALGDTSQMLHITDKAAVGTDWAITSPTHPTLYVHSNTTPITDYLLIGGHDGTTANIDVVGGTTLALKIAGTVQGNVTAAGIDLIDDNSFILGTGLDAELLWSTGDASDHGLVLALGNTSQMLHITDLGAKATDWAVTSPTHPTVYVHSNTTPATDYLAIGAHDGTGATIDVQGGTTLTLTCSAASARVNVADGKALVVGADGVPMTYGGGNFIGLEDSGTDPSGTYTNSLALYTPDAGDSLDFLHADGTTDSLGT